MVGVIAASVLGGVTGIAVVWGCTLLILNRLKEKKRRVVAAELSSDTVMGEMPQGLGQPMIAGGTEDKCSDLPELA